MRTLSASSLSAEITEQESADMLDKGADFPFPIAGELHHRSLLGVEKKLRECLNTLDHLGLSLTAAHVDQSLHQLYRDLAELRSIDEEDRSSSL